MIGEYLMRIKRQRMRYVKKNAAFPQSFCWGCMSSKSGELPPHPAISPPGGEDWGEGEHMVMRDIIKFQKNQMTKWSIASGAHGKGPFVVEAAVVPVDDAVVEVEVPRQPIRISLP